ncbi:MAG: tetratricopeptide repeat protein, partial [Phaeodactylibacter sp.]|nr:tetratricopeptide repeat protein [Phaeodactylibacter sp.]
MNHSLLKITLLCCFLLTTVLLPAQEVITMENASSRSLKGLEAAEAAIAQNDLSKALSELQKVLEKEPKFVDALFLRGSVFYDQKHYDWAEGDFEVALRLAPPDYNKVALFQLAVIEWRLRKFSESAAHFEAYLASDATNERQRELAEEYLEKARFSAEAYAHTVPFDPMRLSD